MPQHMAENSISRKENLGDLHSGGVSKLTNHCRENGFLKEEVKKDYCRLEIQFDSCGILSRHIPKWVNREEESGSENGTGSFIDPSVIFFFVFCVISVICG